MESGRNRTGQHSGRYGDYNALHLYRMFCDLYDFGDNNEKREEKLASQTYEENEDEEDL